MARSSATRPPMPTGIPASRTTSPMPRTASTRTPMESGMMRIATRTNASSVRRTCNRPVDVRAVSANPVSAVRCPAAVPRIGPRPVRPSVTAAAVAVASGDVRRRVRRGAMGVHARTASAQPIIIAATPNGISSARIAASRVVVAVARYPSSSSDLADSTSRCRRTMITVKTIHTTMSPRALGPAQATSPRAINA